jgi:hypothetical protein
MLYVLVLDLHRSHMLSSQLPVRPQTAVVHYSQYPRKRTSPSRHDLIAAAMTTFAHVPAVKGDSMFDLMAEFERDLGKPHF